MDADPASKPLDVASPTPNTMDEVSSTENITVVSATNVEVDKPTPRKRHLRVFIALAVVLLFMLTGTGVFAYGVATERINIQNPDLKKAIMSMFARWSTTPSSAELVLASVYSAHSTVRSGSFDVSLAVSSDAMKPLVPQLGLGNFDVRVKGEYERFGTGNLKAKANISMNSDFNGDIVFLEDALYFKIDKLPIMLFSALGLPVDSTSAFTGGWVKYDLPKVESEARSMLGALGSGDESVRNAQVFVKQLADKGFFKKSNLSNEVYEGENVYRMIAVLEKEDLKLLDDVIKNISSAATYVKLSEIFESPVRIEFIIGKKDYLVRKLAITAKLGPEGQNPSTTSPKYDVAFALELSDFNSPFEFTAPKDASQFENYIQDLSQSLSGFWTPYLLQGVGAIDQLPKTRDATRQSHMFTITNAVYQYAAEHAGELPGGARFPTEETCIGTSSECFDLASQGGADSIVPTYIRSLPQDPITGSEQNTGYYIFQDNGRVNVKALGELQPELSVVR